jgi:hypothetical protein
MILQYEYKVDRTSGFAYSLISSAQARAEIVEKRQMYE